MHLPALTLSLAAFTLLAAPAFAGPGQDLAKTRIADIAKGDVAAVTAAYAPGSSLHWIGGPLDGSYSTPEKVQEVWENFTTAQGEQKATINNIAEAANPKGATVTADVAFAGKSTVKVRYVMVYRNDKLVDEIWQVNPNASY